MATLDDILGNEGGDGGGTPAPKGSQEWHEQQENNPPASPPAKGTQEWAEQNSGNNAPTTTPVSTPAPKKEPQATTSTTTTTQPSEGGGMSYADMFKKLNPYTPPTEEELEKEKKRQKRELMFAAIGDGITALANLFFTTQYAPNMYSGKNTLSERAQVRYDKLKKERDENNAAYANGMQRAMQADERKAEADRAWQRTLGLDEENRAWKQKQWDYKVQQDEDEKAHQTEREKIADERYEEEKRVEGERWQKNFDENKRQTNQSYNRGGNSKYYGNFEGKDYKTEADYNAAVTTIAQELGIPVTEEQSDGVDGMNNPKTKTVRRPIPEVVADIAAKRKEKKGKGY